MNLMEKTKNRAPVNFNYANWQKKLELDRLQKSIDEFTFYPCSKEINQQVDAIISKDVEKKYFVDDLKLLQFRFQALNNFYFLLFEITNFDELKYIDIGRTISDPDYRKNSGKIVSKNLYRLNPHLKDKKRMYNIVSKYLTMEFYNNLRVIELHIRKEKRKASSSKKADDPRLKIYMKVIDHIKEHPKESLQKSCDVIFYTHRNELKALSKKGKIDADSFYTAFVDFFKNNKSRFPEEYQLIQNHKKKVIPRS
jgi:hypothetical protein